MQRRGSRRQDGGANIVVRGPVRGGGGARTGRYNIHARTKEIRLLDGLDGLHRLKLLGGLKRNGRFHLLSGLKGDNRFHWLRSRGGETCACDGRRGGLEVVKVVICKGCIILL